MGKRLDLTMACVMRARSSLRRSFHGLVSALLVFAALTVSAPVTTCAADQITFGIDWRAEAEYGGYYQAVAKGIYAKHGLSVTIREGGPQVNQMQLLMAGRLDFNLGGG